ncbi:hypothetical protein AcW1_009788 [Taiwanofungus camphoratus]|nr:hypothetical protein AcW1_009788 [Antrodia cinnamomea]
MLGLACFVFSTLVASTLAIRMPVRREPIRRQNSPTHSINTTRKSASNVDTLTGFGNLEDTRYVGNITLSGRSYEVILDTGSPDLWVYTGGAPSHYTNTTVPGEINYGASGLDSSIKGYILLTTIEFGDFTIDDQAFINIANINDTGGQLEPGLTGLLGLGPPSETTVITGSLSGKSSASGAPVLGNIFEQNPDLPPQFTFLMSRNDGTQETEGGVFTIGNPDPQLADISNEPQLPIIDADHWTVHFDAIIINGQRFNQSAGGSSNLTAILDTGTPTALIDPNFVDIIYGSNAQTTLQGLASIVPCDAQYNISFMFGGIELPINPIDAAMPYALDDDGNLVCVGAFYRLAGWPGGATGTFLLGDTFLRNVYSLYNFNHWQKSGDEPPFVQLLSVTDANKAAGQFSSSNAARLKAFEQSLQSSSSSNLAVGDALADESSSSSSPVDLSILTRNTYIIMGMLCGALVVLILIAVFAIRSSRASTGKGYRVIGADQTAERHQTYNSDYRD